MPELSNLFGESEIKIWNRLSSLFIFLFIYYQLASYMILKKGMGCRNMPEINVVVMILAAQLIQVYCIFKLHSDGSYVYAWLVAVVPLFLFFVYKQHSKKRELRERRKIQYMLHQIQKQKNQNGPVFDQPHTTTGIQNQMIKQQMDSQYANQIKQPMPHNGGTSPGYGDYVSQYDSVYDSSVLAETLDPYKKQFSHVPYY